MYLLPTNHIYPQIVVLKSANQSPKNIFLAHPPKRAKMIVLREKARHTCRALGSTIGHEQTFLQKPSGAEILKGLTPNRINLI